MMRHALLGLCLLALAGMGLSFGGGNAEAATPSATCTWVTLSSLYSCDNYVFTGNHIAINTPTGIWPFQTNHLCHGNVTSATSGVIDVTITENISLCNWTVGDCVTIAAPDSWNGNAAPLFGAAAVCGPPPAVGGVAEQVDVSALASATALPDRSRAGFVFGGAIAAIAAAVAATAALRRIRLR